MYKTTINRLFMIFLMFCIFNVCISQPPRGPFITSPKVRPDINIGLTNTDKFAYTCYYAPYTSTEEFEKNFTNRNPNAEKMNKQLKLFTISVGTEDFLYESVKKNIALTTTLQELFN